MYRLLLFKLCTCYKIVDDGDRDDLFRVDYKDEQKSNGKEANPVVKNYLRFGRRKREVLSDEDIYVDKFDKEQNYIVPEEIRQDDYIIGEIGQSVNFIEETRQKGDISNQIKENESMSIEIEQGDNFIEERRQNDSIPREIRQGNDITDTRKQNDIMTGGRRQREIIPEQRRQTDDIFDLSREIEVMPRERRQREIIPEQRRKVNNLPEQNRNNIIQPAEKTKADTLNILKRKFKEKVELIKIYDKKRLEEMITNLCKYEIDSNSTFLKNAIEQLKADFNTSFTKISEEQDNIASFRDLDENTHNCIIERLFKILILQKIELLTLKSKIMNLLNDCEASCLANIKEYVLKVNNDTYDHLLKVYDEKSLTNSIYKPEIVEELIKVIESEFSEKIKSILARLTFYRNSKTSQKENIKEIIGEKEDVSSEPYLKLCDLVVDETNVLIGILYMFIKNKTGEIGDFFVDNRENSHTMLVENLILLLALKNDEYDAMFDHISSNMVN